MKKIILGIFVVFLFIGCTTKVQTDIKPYVTLHQNEVENLSINFIGVNDKRDTQIVSTIYNDNKIENQYPLSSNVQKWYQEAFKREFENAKMLNNKNVSGIDVIVNITKISAKYTKYSLDSKNMSANIKIELVIKKDNKTITSQIESNQTLYKPMILDAEGFESILNEGMRDSVSKTVAILIEKVK